MNIEACQTQINQALASIETVVGGKVQADKAIICGSGIAGIVDNMSVIKSIPFADIAGFTDCSVEGHTGTMVIARAYEQNVIIMQGRLHLYEGLDPSVYLFYIGLLSALGVKNLIITNAVGGIREDYVPGDVVLISDHINLTGKSPLTGLVSQDRSMFVNMEGIYQSQVSQDLKKAGNKAGIDIKDGVYLGTHGPHFETPAEIRAFKVLGGDVVGMSTVLEVIAAQYYELSIGVVSVITNMAAGISQEKITHDLTLHTANLACEKVYKLVDCYLSLSES